MDIGQVAEHVAVLGGLTGMLVAGRAAILGGADYTEARWEYDHRLSEERKKEVGEPRIWEHVQYYLRETIPSIVSLVRPKWLYEVRLDKPFRRYVGMDRQSQRQRVQEAAGLLNPLSEQEFQQIGL